MIRLFFGLGIAAALSGCATGGTSYDDNAARIAAGTTSGVVEPGTGNYVPSGAIRGRITNSTNGTVRPRAKRR